IYKGDTTTYVCYDTLVDKEDSELFNTEKVLLHVLRADDLLEPDVNDLFYEIEVKTKRGKVTSAATSAVKPVSFLRPTNNWDAFGFGENEFKINTSAPANSQVYVITADVGYRDFRLRGNQIDTVDQQFRFTVARYVASRPSDGIDPVTGGEAVFRAVTQSDQFYSALATHIRQNSDTVNMLYRKFKGVVFNATVGNPDLALAMSNGSSSMGFADQLVYNNVNNGFGYVSAYNRGATQRLPVSRATVDIVNEKYPQFRFEK
ncbi:MAG: hypothetical protein R6U85_10575, partial [Salinivirgaceae bacterium]